MSSSLHQHCLNHPGREAAARCPECQRSFCRECITEHDYRMICAGCLQGVLQPKEARRHWTRLPLVLLAPLLQLVIGLLVLWTVYYQVGEVLVNIPAQLHAGEAWEEPDSK